MRLLIANRGEIAVRIARSARQLGMEVVALIPKDEKSGLLPGLSDIAIDVNSAGIFTDVNQLVALACENQCGLVHPGYGFLSEQAAFARFLAEQSILFAGPSPETLAIAGDKVASKRLARGLQIPVLPDYQPDELPTVYPILVKPAGGGGGKGMHIAWSADELPGCVADAGRLADRLYGNPQVLIEGYLPDARHIEVQLLADRQGRMVHLFDRDCSVQRGFQKVVEEAPATSISQEVRQRLFDYACHFARAAGFYGAGTVEFLVDPDNRVYFLEMNPRIQVEHTVTEAITDIDIVAWQLRIALGEGLPFEQEEVSCRGHAIQWRLNAEIPSEGFRASAGEVVFFEAQKQARVRVDTWLDRYGNISPEFDSLLAKIVIHGSSREEALSESHFYLTNELQAAGISTNQYFLQTIATHPVFTAGQWTTNCLSLIAGEWKTEGPPLTGQEKRIIAMGFVYLTWLAPEAERPSFCFNKAEIPVVVEGEEVALALERQFGQWRMEAGRVPVDYSVTETSPNRMKITIGGDRQDVFVAVDKSGNLWLGLHGRWCMPQSPWLLRHAKFFARSTVVAEGLRATPVVSPLYGAVAEVFIAEGREVNPGDQLLSIESMKTENIIRASAKATVQKVLVKKNDRVTDKSVLIEFE